jgi:tetratricopeptide (TPR) repeat protein
MLSFLGFLLTIAWKVVRNFKILREEKKFPLVILCVAFAGALAHNLVDYNLNFATNAVIFWLLLIFIDETATGPVAAALPHHAASPHTVPSLHHATKAKMDSRIDAACWTGLVILAVTASFALAESYSYLQISLASRNPKQVNGQALLALESNSLYSTYSLLDQANKALAKGENALAEQYYVVQVRKNPWDAGAFNSLGELEAKAGQPTQALGYFDQALLLDNKNYWLYYLNKLEALQSLNDTAGLAAFSDQLATEFAQYVPEAETNIHFTAQSQNALVAETVLKNLLKTGSGNAAVFQQDLDQLTAAVAKFQGPGQGFQEAA